VNRLPLALLLALGGPPALAQWKPVAIDTKADFRGLSVVGPDVVWASGTGGTVARTADGGKTWAVIAVPGAAKLDFRDVKGFGRETAYLLAAGPGDASRIYKTTDGGRTWAEQYRAADPATFLDAMAFWDERHGLALGDPVGGRFQLLTTDDGATWKPLPAAGLPPALPGEGAFAASGTCLVARGEGNAWFVTGGGKAGRVFRTADHGRTWAVAETPVASGVPSAGIFSIAFRNRDNGLVVGGDYRKPDAAGATAATTADGGRTWTPLAGRLPYCSAVAWAGDRWVAVGPAGSHASRDDGATWVRLGREGYNSVGFAPTGVGWAVGPAGRVGMFAE
jgi:photosystem II stability/assembly factor-like uncharacterized protein